MLGNLRLRHASKDLLVHGITRVPATDSAEQSDVSFTRVRDDKGCESPFETWLRSKEHGSLSVDLEDGCGNRTNVCFEGHACKLERHDLKQCDSDLPTETLTVRLGPAPVCAPVALPKAPVARFSADLSLLCFSFKLYGGCVSTAKLSLQNVFPCPAPSGVGTWSFVAGPAPGTPDPLYTSPKMLFVEACLETGITDQASVTALYEYLHENFKPVLVLTEEDTGCKVEVGCFNICFPPKPNVAAAVAAVAAAGWLMSDHVAEPRFHLSSLQSPVSTENWTASTGAFPGVTNNKQGQRLATDLTTTIVGYGGTDLPEEITSHIRYSTDRGLTWNDSDFEYKYEENVNTQIEVAYDLKAKHFYAITSTSSSLTGNIVIKSYKSDDGNMWSATTPPTLSAPKREIRMDAHTGLWVVPAIRTENDTTTALFQYSSDQGDTWNSHNITMPITFSNVCHVVDETEDVLVGSSSIYERFLTLFKKDNYNTPIYIEVGVEIYDIRQSKKTKRIFAVGIKKNIKDQLLYADPPNYDETENWTKVDLPTEGNAYFLDVDDETVIIGLSGENQVLVSTQNGEAGSFEFVSLPDFDGTPRISSYLDLLSYERPE
jgi:hypothetical protein